MLDHTLPPSRRRASPASAAIAATLGLLALFLALPRLQVEGVILAAKAAIAEGQRAEAQTTDGGRGGTPMDLDTARALAARLKDAAETGRSPEAYSLAGQAHLLAVGRALAQRDSMLVASNTQAAAEAFRSALAANPAAPYDWARLAYADFFLNQRPAAADAWSMSVRTGSFDPALMERRLILGWAMREWLEPPVRAAFDEQIWFSWRLDGGWTTLFAHRHGAVSAVRHVLAGSPTDLADFENRLRSLTPN